MTNSNFNQFDVPNVLVTQNELEKYQNNERVKQCLKKYVCDDYKVGSTSQKAI